MTVEQRLSFDEVVDFYDRARPGYPPSLFDDLVSLSGIGPGGRILEIGCGTGQATRDLARRGFRVLCLEPGVALTQRARENLASFPDVEFVSQTFEAWPLEANAFDLVVAAQVFHWIPSEVGLAKAGAALRPGGSLAVFGNVPLPDASVIRQALDEAYAEHAPSLAGDAAIAWYADEDARRLAFRDSRLFAPVTARRYPWSSKYETQAFLDLLETFSDHRMLEAEQRRSLLGAIRRIVEGRGGIVEVPYEAHLYLARRRP